MDLQLAIIRSCLGDRCKIRMLDNEAALEVRFDHRPSDSTRLRFGQLVAVDMCQAPAIVWRWHRASLLAWLPDTLLVCLPEGRLLWVGIGCVDPADLRFAPEVWVTQAGKGWEAHDAILEGAPAHPEQLLRWVERRPIPVAA